MLNQKLQLKLSQKLSPQQIQLMKLIQLTTAELEQKINTVFDFRPSAIVRDLKLNEPRYSITSSGGHFGRPYDSEGHFEWERLDENRINAL